MKKTLRKLASFAVRWGIAIVGIWWVVMHMSLADHAMWLNPSDPSNHPVKVQVVGEAAQGYYRIVNPAGQTKDVAPGDLVNAPDPDYSTVRLKGTGQQKRILWMDLAAARSKDVDRLLVAGTANVPGQWITPGEVVGGYHLPIEYVKVEEGLWSKVRQANPCLLILSMAIFPVTIIVTSVRWRRLLAALDIPLTLSKTLALNWVGLFYNTFIPMGSTGGDLLKAYYAAKHTHYKTRAVMSVIVDRVIGLVVLVIMGGGIAGGYYLAAANKTDPAVTACWWVAMSAGLILAGGVVFLAAAYTPGIRAMIGFEKLISKLPLQSHVQSAVEVMSIYRRRPGLIIWAMLVTFPVHITVVISVIFACMAFRLPLTWGYYFIVVPVTVLAGAMPISPQGIGVMEWVAKLLMEQQQHATMTDVVALTMSIRVVQILWNLVGGVFVATGHYHAPKQGELEDSSAPAANEVSGA